MPKAEKVKVNVKERVEDNICDLSLSELSEVPLREIASFKRVTTVDLSSNRLITLGKNFPSLTRLVKLDLSKNQIRYLPDDFGLLRNLRHLDLFDNRLEHLPLSFGDLTQLRYLDLKGNPLMPALAKIVGHCLTSKECQDSARNTVKFLSRMQTEAEKAKAQFKQDAYNSMGSNAEEAAAAVGDDKSAVETQKSRKSNKKSKSKNKKSNNETTKEVNTTTSATTTATISTSQQAILSKSAKPKKSTASNGALKGGSSSSTALTSILTFFMLLAINIVIIYTIMFKNPEIADKLVEYVPQQYRDWILTKTEIFRLRVSDWISEFRTPPEEH